MTLSDLGTAVVVGRPWPVEDVSDRSLPTRGFLPRTPQLGLAASSDRSDCTPSGANVDIGSPERLLLLEARRQSTKLAKVASN